MAIVAGFHTGAKYSECAGEDCKIGALGLEKAFDFIWKSGPTEETISELF
jgi:hypothetical protein